MKGGNFVVGIALHSAIAKVVAARADGNEPNVREVWKTTWNEEATKPDVELGILPEGFENDGYRLFHAAVVADYVKALRPMRLADGRLASELKVELSVPGVGLPLVAYVDLITDDGTVVDFKTAKRAWSEWQGKTEMQPLVYLAALNQSGVPHTPGAFRHVVMTKTKTVGVQVIDTPRDWPEIFWYLGVIREVSERIERGDFPRNPKSCFSYGEPCPFLKPCREGK